jgi:ring-1,2-phenylacetyl-CoA epoxidase subunit PaaC
MMPATIPARPGSAAADALDAPTRGSLAELLLTMADDEFVSGFTDSEWTGIAPLLEEDVAISSIAQDELGHARALYQLLADVVDDGRDEDALAYDREPDEYRHARLLDHARGDWAHTIARRFLYELADEARLASIGPGYRPLADLVEKLKREERYHRMHVLAWIDRLARGGREARSRIEAALVAQEIDAPTVFTPLDGEAALLDAGILTRSMADAEAAWRADLTTILVPLELALPPHIPLTPDGRRQHSDSFRWLWGEFTSVRRSEGRVAW